MQEQLDPDAELSQWVTFDNFDKEHENFRRAQIEWLYRHRSLNGLDDVFRKIGKSRYIHKRRFAKALNEGRG